MAKQRTTLEAVGEPLSASSPGNRPPLALTFAVVAVLALGAIMYLTRPARSISSTFDSISHSGALLDTDHDKDGLTDYYARVVFNNNRAGVANLFTLCAREPQSALKIFRHALDSGNKDAKLIALSASFYLAIAHDSPITKEKPIVPVLQAEDFDRILRCMKAESGSDEQVRKAAQRALSDLTVITDAGNSKDYEEVPAGTAPSPQGAPAHKVQTHAEMLKMPSGDSKPCLNVRWSNLVLAESWWNKFGVKGKWNPDLQRYVIP